MATDIEPNDDPPEDDLPADEPLPLPPRPRPQPNIWWSLLALFGLLVLMVIAQIAVFVPVWLVLASVDGNLETIVRQDAEAYQRAMTASGDGTDTPRIPERLATALMACTLSGHSVMLLYTWILARKVFGRSWTRAVALRRPGVAQLLIALLVFLPGLMFAHEGIHTLVVWLSGSSSNRYLMGIAAIVIPAPVWLSVLTIAVMPGVAEELFFRGFIGRGLVGRHGWFFGVLLTSALFGLFHLDPLYAIGAAAMGVGLHYVLVTSRSLWVTILLHLVNNGCSVAAFLLQPSSADTPVSPLATILRYGSAVALLGLGGWALWSCRAKVAPVDDNNDGWKPRFPTVATPPPDSGLTTIEGRPNPLPLILAIVPFGGLVFSMFIH